MELIEFWSACDLETSPFVHPCDAGIIAEQGHPVTLLDGHRAFVDHGTFAGSNDQSLHLSLLPVPFQGDLRKADIFVVMLNPGLGVGDYLTQ